MVEAIARKKAFATELRKDLQQRKEQFIELFVLSSVALLCLHSSMQSILITHYFEASSRFNELVLTSGDSAISGSTYVIPRLALIGFGARKLTTDIQQGNSTATTTVTMTTTKPPPPTTT